MKVDLTAETLRSLLVYNSESGIFHWRVSALRRPVGSVAGKTKKYGYREIRIYGRDYAAHRLAWLYVYGEWPNGSLDHADGDKINNAISNLRIATASENGANAKRSLRNKSGYKGVSFCTRSQKWRAFIVINCKGYHLGLHSTPEEAYAAYCSAAITLREEFARVA